MFRHIRKWKFVSPDEQVSFMGNGLNYKHHLSIEKLYEYKDICMIARNNSARKSLRLIAPS